MTMVPVRFTSAEGEQSYMTFQTLIMLYNEILFGAPGRRGETRAPLSDSGETDMHQI
jgi:hypothetical protein